MTSIKASQKFLAETTGSKNSQVNEATLEVNRRRAARRIHNQKKNPQRGREKRGKQMLHGEPGGRGGLRRGRRLLLTAAATVSTPADPRELPDSAAGGDPRSPHAGTLGGQSNAPTCGGWASPSDIIPRIRSSGISSPLVTITTFTATPSQPGGDSARARRRFVKLSINKYPHFGFHFVAQIEKN